MKKRLCARAMGRDFLLLAHFLMPKGLSVLHDLICYVWINNTRHDSTDSVPTSNLVCIKEVAIRLTFGFVE